MRIYQRLRLLLLLQRGHLFCWAPVLFACGIGLYFQLSTEPNPRSYWIFAIGSGILTLIALRFPGAFSPLLWGGALFLAGFCIAGWRAHSVADVVLGWRYYGPVEGRVIKLDRSSSDAVRVTLDQVSAGKISAARTPGRVRVSLHGAPADLQPGARIRVMGHLVPPQGPAEPGGFNFRRHAWFQGLGAVGYTRKSPEILSDPDPRGVRVFAVRMAISARVQDKLPGQSGGFAAAITTGDRSAVALETLTALRKSNLAHLLAISGLHMGLLAGFVFAVLRVGFALAPSVALRWPIKKISAVGALGAAAIYLALSGGNVATQRAFIMVAVVFVAVLLDRRAFSLRAVAVAAMIVLTLRPEALTGPGFQMSFAATSALIAVFGALRGRNWAGRMDWAKPVLGVVLSSAVAGLATAPFAAAHFNTLSHYGLIANLLSVPLMGVLVMPAAVLAACLAPFGLESVGLWIMNLGIRWILGVAHWVSALPGAQGQVVQPGPWVLPLLALGMLWVILWQGRARTLGLLAVISSFYLWSTAERSEILIADTGGLVGVMTDQGRALSKARGAGFIARIWLENDGDPATQQQAATRWPENNSKNLRRFGNLVHVIGKRGAQQITACAADDIVIASVRMDLPGGCDLYDPDRLRKTGSLALRGGQITTARQIEGARLWSPRRLPWD